MRGLDLTGYQYGRLTYIEPTYVDAQGQRRWRCLCSCGKETEVKIGHRKVIKSCGCLARERSVQSGRDSATHGMSKHPHYKLLMGMKNRCYNPNNHKRPYYYDKGIQVCKEWVSDIVAFSAWCYASGWEEGLTIDRIDPDGDYSPENCRFITREENSARVIH